MLGFILGPMPEENFRRALLLSRGSFTTFFTLPISGPDGIDRLLHRLAGGLVHLPSAQEERTGRRAWPKVENTDNAVAPCQTPSSSRNELT
jgi:TctA family transporter